MTLKSTYERHWALIFCCWLVGMPLLAEVYLQLKWRRQNGQWKFQTARTEDSPFITHPILVGTGRPSHHLRKGDVSITHNEQGMRQVKPLTPKRQGITRIVLLGGSTTYATQVSDEHTWGVRLETLLGDQYEVFNLGIPGYGTAENLIQTAFHFSEINPDIAIYYEGWNDLRNAGDKTLKADYSDFHFPSQLTSLSLVPKTFFDRLALPEALARSWRNSPAASINQIDWTKSPDPRALGIYRRNLDLIGALCKAQGVTPIFAPQILNDRAFAGPSWLEWSPFLIPNQIPQVARDYGKVMKKSAAAAKIAFVEDLLVADFQGTDFLDEGHFSASGKREVRESTL